VLDNKKSNGNGVERDENAVKSLAFVQEQRCKSDNCEDDKGNYIKQSFFFACKVYISQAH
jgi:hypothetical protein